VSLFNYIFICLSETWVSDSFVDNELGLINYAVFRCDRNSDTSNCYRGGGALIDIRNDVVGELLPTIAYNVSIYLLDSTYKMSPLLSVPSISLLIAQFSSMSHLCPLSKLLSLSIQVVYS